jgi:glycosyltransferase involved in cell wall biosynthesis
MHVLKKGDLKSYYSTTQLLNVTMKATWNLSRSAIRSQADIVHIGKPHPMNSMAGLSARIFNRSELYLDCDDFEAESGRFSSSWQKSIISNFEKWMPHRVKSITTNTFFMREKLISWGIPAELIFYLPNGIDRDRFSSPDPERVGKLRKELRLEGTKVVGYIGSLSESSHSVKLLLEAFRKIIERQSNSSLILVGGGEDIYRLKDFSQELGISHATRFCGKALPENVPLYYSLADVSVDPVYDNDAAKGRSPLKLFESWFCGVPFVTGDVGDRKMLLQDSRAGLLAQPGDPNSLADAICLVLSNPRLAHSLREEGKRKVKDYYWDHLVNDLENVYLNRPLNNISE